MSLRIGIVDYLNSWPLAWGFLSGRLTDGVEVSYHPPAGVAAMLAAGELDAGLIPSIEVQRIPGLAVVPGLCVAATHEVRSVLLLSRRPFEEIRTVALDENSRTSATLVRVLLRDLYGVAPETWSGPPQVGELPDGTDAALVIGDPALRVDRGRYRILDLAAEWRRLTGRPFVFAVWATREAVDGGTLAGTLHASLGVGLEQMHVIIERAVEQVGLTPDVAERYLLRHLRYAMGAEELEGLEEFYRRAAGIGAIDRATPVRFVQGSLS